MDVKAMEAKFEEARRLPDGDPLRSIILGLVPDLLGINLAPEARVEVLDYVGERLNHWDLEIQLACQEGGIYDSAND